MVTKHKLILRFNHLLVPSAAPINIRSKALDSTGLEISWDPPPPEHRNGRITNYTLKYREKGGRAR